MKFDVIIATYNRQKSLELLVNDILDCSLTPENIIIVDSSNEVNKEIIKYNKVKYIKASRKNQPYQRYLGFKNSENKILVYFDDDMRIIDKYCFGKILEQYKFDDIVAVQPDFTYEHEFLDKITPKSKVRELAKKNSFFKFLKTLSGNPELKDGKFWFNGLRGQLPKNKEYIEYFRGPVFSVKRDVLYQDFNFRLFDLYDQKLGKAEDAILGFTVSHQGKIVYLSNKMFLHDDQNDSVYAKDLKHYNERVAFSRLYLSFEYARLAKKSFFKSIFYYNVFILGRLSSLIINQLINYNQDRTQIIYGYLKGYCKAIFKINFLKGNRNKC